MPYCANDFIFVMSILPTVCFTNMMIRLKLKITQCGGVTLLLMQLQVMKVGYNVQSIER